MSKRKRLRFLIRHFQENGVKLLLENPGNMRELLQILAFRLQSRIDFTQMRVVPGRFVGRDFRHLESDLVLQAPIQAEADSEQKRIFSARANTATARPPMATSQ